MAVVLNMCFSFQIIVFKLYWEFPLQSKFPTVLICLMFFTIMFNPLEFLHRPARYEVCFTIANIIVAPFRKVEFRHFFLADVITSSKLMLTDSSQMVCFYTSDEYHSLSPMSCMWTSNLNYFWGMVPYWWRFWQCCRRVYDDRSNTS